MADLGPGNDSLRVEGSLRAVGSVRLAGGLGNDTIHGGPEDDLIEAGPGADQLYGGAGADGLIGGLPGPTYLYGGRQRRPAGGRRRLRRRRAGRRPRPRRRLLRRDPGPPRPALHLLPAAQSLDRRGQGLRPGPPLATDEDMEGSFDYDVLIGDSGPNAMLGQPGEDRFYGNGGDDMIDARDGVRDELDPVRAGQRRSGAGIRARPDGAASSTPSTRRRSAAPPSIIGPPVPGLGRAGDHASSR